MTADVAQAMIVLQMNHLVSNSAILQRYKEKKQSVSCSMPTWYFNRRGQSYLVMMYFEKQHAGHFFS